MKTKIQGKKYESVLLAIISLIAGFYTDVYYSSFMPDFDIGFNAAFTTLKCWLLILVLWGIELGIFRLLKKQITNPRNLRWASVAVMIAYWLIVWGFCRYQYIVKATQDWNDTMNEI